MTVKAVTELLVRAADLAEAEGRVLRMMTVRVALAVGLVVVAALTAGAGAGALLGGLYLALAPALGAAGAAAGTGVAALILGGSIAWTARRMAR